jgi:tetratricopeptide (TPR) repeat protein
MAKPINRDDAGAIAHKLTESRNSLQKGNVFSCLLAFKEVLEKMTSTQMIPADEKALMNEINDFQTAISKNRLFRDLYGPVTFRDNEIEPALELMTQLIQIKNEEMTELLREPDEQEAAPDTANEPGKTADSSLKAIQILLEKGDHAKVQEMLKDHEDWASILAETYNSAGIDDRRKGNYDEAVREFRMALVASPNDEGIYYNMARVYLAKEEFKTAAETINEGLKINHDFPQGIQLLKYIRETGKVDL